MDVDELTPITQRSWSGGQELWGFWASAMSEGGIVLSSVPMPVTIRLYIVEGQLLFGKALCQLFAREGTVSIVGDSETLSATSLAKSAPDVILLDVDGRPAELTEMIALCRQAAPEARVCVLSLRLQSELMQRCLAAGAEGYVIKDATPQDLMRAVKMVAAGETYVDPRVAGGLLRRRCRTNGRPEFEELSVRELDVIRFIAEGLSNKEISARLYLSEKTVKNHISRIFSKLNISARSQAAVHAVRMGLL